MEIGVSTACFYPSLTETVPALLKSMGVKCAEVFLNSMSEYETEFCLRLKEEMDRADVRVVSVHSFVAMHEPFLFAQYERRAKDALEIYKKVVHAASLLGAKFHTFHGARREYSGEIDIKDFGRRMSYLANVAGEQGVTLSWENVSWCASANPSFVSNCMEYVDSKNIGFTLDLKQAIRADYNYVEYLSVFGDKLNNIHVSDKNGLEDCMLPGRGNTDFKGFFEDLDRCGYGGDCIIEVYNNAFKRTEELRKSVEYLRKLRK